MLILSGAHAAGSAPRSPTTILRHRRSHDGQFPVTETVRQQDPYRPQSVLSGGVLEGPVRRHGGRTQRSRARRGRIGAEGREVPESQVRTLARKAVGPGDARAVTAPRRVARHAEEDPPVEQGSKTRTAPEQLTSLPGSRGSTDS